MKEIRQNENPIKREANTASINRLSVTVISLGMMGSALAIFFYPF